MWLYDKDFEVLVCVRGGSLCVCRRMYKKSNIGSFDRKSFINIVKILILS